MYEDCLRDQSGNCHTAGCTNPDIHPLVYGLLRATREPTVAFQPEGGVRDTTREARREKETRPREWARGCQAAKREGHTNHQTVVEPVIEAEGAPVEERVIQMEGVTTVDRGPRKGQSGGLGRLGGKEGITNIGGGQCHDEGVVNHVNRVVGAFQTESLDGAIQGGEPDGDCGSCGEPLEDRKDRLHLGRVSGRDV
jgi:hypothetical protein